MAMRSILKQPEKNAHRDPGEKGWVWYYCGKEGNLKKNCPQTSKPPLAPWSAKDHTARETAPRAIGFRARTLKTIRTEGAWGSPTQALVLITPEEPQVSITVGGQCVDFLLNTGATYSVLTDPPDLLSFQPASVMRLSG